MIQSYFCKFFILFYYKYTKLNRQIYENGTYLQKQNVLKVEGLDRHAVLVFEDQELGENRHAEDSTEADWLAGCRKQRERQFNITAGKASELPAFSHERVVQIAGLSLALVRAHTAAVFKNLIQLEHSYKNDYFSF